MDSYIEIKLKPDAEMRLNCLLNMLYTKLHKALFDLSANNIGVSFPAYKITLGDMLRLHGTQTALEQLQAKNWIGGMSGYCQLSAIQAVPDQVKYRTVSRKQSTMSHAKLNRLLKRESIAPEQTPQYKAKMFAKGLDDPYIELTSSSNGHKHRRYIEFGALQAEPVAGEFDQFGLSKTATVPWF
jgi:CRISPR-associated endonuclease Csy4